MYITHAFNLGCAFVAHLDNTKTTPLKSCEKLSRDTHGRRHLYQSNSLYPWHVIQKHDSLYSNITKSPSIVPVVFSLDSAFPPFFACPSLFRIRQSFIKFLLMIMKAKEFFPWSRHTLGSWVLAPFSWCRSSSILCDNSFCLWRA